MQSLQTIFNAPNNQTKKLFTSRQPKSYRWWTPIWRGLAADPDGKHRKAMSSSVWLYLYLLTYANRKTGVIRRKPSQIREDTGFPPRTIQRYLQQLARKNYIAVARAKQYLHVQIKKWKSFKNSNL